MRALRAIGTSASHTSAIRTRRFTFHVDRAGREHADAHGLVALLAANSAGNLTLTVDGIRRDTEAHTQLPLPGSATRYNFGNFVLFPGVHTFLITTDTPPATCTWTT